MKNQFLKLLSIPLLLVAMIASGQVNYQKRTLNGVVTYRPETIPGSAVFDGTPVSTLPSGAVVARYASRVGKLWQPELAKHTLNLAQFGTASNSAQIYKFSIDFRPAEISHDQWRSYGINMISKWTSDQGTASSPGLTYPFSGVPDNQKFDYSTESHLHGGKEGHGFWASTLAEMEIQYRASIPAYGPGAHWTANIETSNYWARDAYHNDDGSGGWGHYPRWADVKTNTIQLESTAAINAFGPSCSLETLFSNPGIQQQEADVRRANRLSIMLKCASRNGAYASYGSAAYQGEPKTDALSTSNRFLDGNADVSHIPGYSGTPGTITLNGNTYTGLTGSFYKHETCHLDYHYYFDCLYDGQAVGTQFLNSSSAYMQLTDYPTMYQKLTNKHPIAREVGHWLAIQKRLKEVHDGQSIPIIRMHELFYEDNYSRVPYAFNTPLGDGAPTKIWVAPYVARIQRMVPHFLEGEKPGSGFHIFHSNGAPNQGIIWNLATTPAYNHHLHTVTALFAASRDMQTVLDKINGSVLTTDIDIKINNTGSFQTVNGVQAYALGPDGGQGTLLPCFVTRHKFTSAGTYVIFMGGMDQGWNTTRTDVIRIPGVGNGNTIKVTYKGPDLQFFEVLFPNGVSNTEFTAQSIVPVWQRSGYGGRINNN